MSKYGNRKVEIDGYTFDSQKEARRYQELKLLQLSGEITGLELQPSFILIPSYTYQGRKVRKMEYRADFAYLENGKRVVEDVKGMKTEKYRIKKKLLLYQNQDMDFREI
jgi:hypothetical protein